MCHTSRGQFDTVCGDLPLNVRGCDSWENATDLLQSSRNRQDIHCLVLVSMLFPVRLDIWTADLTSVLFCFIEKVSFPLLKIQRCIHLCLCRFLRILTCLHLPARLLLFKSKSFIKQYSDHDFSYAVFRQCDCISAHICNCVTAYYTVEF